MDKEEKMRSTLKISKENPLLRAGAFHESSDFIIVLTTAPKREEAEALAAYIVSERLGACVQIKEIESFYLWQDELVPQKSFELSIKNPQKNTI
jgi:hypothetical protein